MSNKQVFGTISLSIFVFLLLLIVVTNIQDSNTWTDVATGTTTSLELLWTNLFPAVLIQGFVLFAALLGVSLQFTPVKKH